MVEGIVALAEQCKEFPETAKASAEEAGLGPFEIPGAVRIAHSLSRLNVSLPLQIFRVTSG
eukprot:SAG11_NODE_2557_length_3221_cov_3.516336_6_plen_61_part_00